MSAEIAKRQSAEVERAQPTNMLEAVMRAASDPQVDPARLRELLEIGERLEARQAKQDFDAHMREMQPELPTIKKNGLISYGAGKGTTTFARWDDIHKACMPVLHKHGFSCSFSSDMQAPNALKVTIRVKGWGHEETGSLVVPWLDAGGSKSPAQQAASSFTLAERHCFVKFFNILTEDRDDDGSGKGVPDRITEEQSMRISDILEACEQKQPKFRQKFLEWMKLELKAASVEQLFQGQQLNAVMAKLKEKQFTLGVA